MIIELCIASIKDAILAEKYGIERVELNSALELGGLSPNLSTVEYIKANTNLKVIAMLRNRAGGFIYDEYDMKIMLDMAEDLLKAGADGLAFGALCNDSSIDTNNSLRVMEIIKKYNAEFVFHRAFDMQNKVDAVKSLIHIGVNRLLTSGLKSNAWEGRDNIKAMQTLYGDKIEILAGSGINSDNILKIAEYTGVKQLHGSFSEQILQKGNSDIDFGNYTQTSEDKLKKLHDILKIHNITL